MDTLLLAGILGGVGGLTRGLVGLMKALSLRRKILWNYYAITVLIAIVLGIFVGIIFDFDYRLSLLAGCRLPGSLPCSARRHSCLRAVPAVRPGARR